jgi:hypothetical protein
MTGKVFGFTSYDLAKPVPHFRAVYFIIIYPTLFARVVGRVNVDALHLSRVVGEQGFEGEQVIALDEEVVV